jgi:hypothetical protein
MSNRQPGDQCGCNQCLKYVSAYFCCGWEDCYEFGQEPGGPFPAYWVLNIDSNVPPNDCCMRIEGDTVVITKAGQFRIAYLESYGTWSYTLNGALHTDGSFHDVVPGDVLSDFTLHNQHCDVECTFWLINYGSGVGGPMGAPLSTRVCFGITYTGTYPIVFSTVDCGSPVDCGD